MTTKVVGNIALILVIIVATLMLGILIAALIKFGIESAKEKITDKKEEIQAHKRQRELEEIESILKTCKPVIMEAYFTKWYAFQTAQILPAKTEKQKNALIELELQVIRCEQLLKKMNWTTNPNEFYGTSDDKK